MPVVDLEMPTLCLVGAPNVGKSSLVRVLSTGKPEVCNYPFTTRGILMGHITLSYQHFQVCIIFWTWNAIIFKFLFYDFVYIENLTNCRWQTHLAYWGEVMVKHTLFVDFCLIDCVKLSLCVFKAQTISFSLYRLHVCVSTCWCTWMFLLILTQQ